MIDATVSQRRDLESERQIRETEEQRQLREVSVFALVSESQLLTFDSIQNTVAKQAAIRTEISDVLRPFYCQLCDKQYANVGQYDEHCNTVCEIYLSTFSVINKFLFLFFSVRPSSQSP